MASPSLFQQYRGATATDQSQEEQRPLDETELEPLPPAQEMVRVQLPPPSPNAIRGKIPVYTAATDVTAGTSTTPITTQRPPLPLPNLESIPEHEVPSTSVQPPPPPHRTRSRSRIPSQGTPAVGTPASVSATSSPIRKDPLQSPPRPTVNNPSGRFGMDSPTLSPIPKKDPPVTYASVTKQTQPPPATSGTRGTGPPINPLGAAYKPSPMAPPAVPPKKSVRQALFQDAPPSTSDNDWKSRLRPRKEPAKAPPSSGIPGPETGARPKQSLGRGKTKVLFTTSTRAVNRQEGAQNQYYVPPTPTNVDNPWGPFMASSKSKQPTKTKKKNKPKRLYEFSSGEEDN